MTRGEAYQLHPGDEVTHPDPDTESGFATRTICEVDHSDLFRNVITLRFTDGTGWTGHHWELS